MLMESLRAIFGIFLMLIIDGHPKEKAWGCGCLVAVLGILSLAGYGLYKLLL